MIAVLLCTFIHQDWNYCLHNNRLHQKTSALSSWSLCMFAAPFPGVCWQGFTPYIYSNEILSLCYGKGLAG